MPLDATDVGGRFRWTLTLLLAAVAGGGAIDLVLDQPATAWSFHVLFEVAMLILSLAAIAWLWFGWRDTHAVMQATRRALDERGTERDAWRARAEKLLRGLGDEIDGQLRAWGLTTVERDTALLLLKGFGHKEIASIQGKSERTVRQHAVSIYRKAGLSGRAELSAFFLEDLLLPTESEADPGSSPTD